MFPDVLDTADPLTPPPPPVVRMDGWPALLADVNGLGSAYLARSQPWLLKYRKTVVDYAEAVRECLDRPYSAQCLWDYTWLLAEAATRRSFTPRTEAYAGSVGITLADAHLTRAMIERVPDLGAGEAEAARASFESAWPHAENWEEAIALRAQGKSVSFALAAGPLEFRMPPDTVVHVPATLDSDAEVAVMYSFVAAFCYWPAQLQHGAQVLGAEALDTLTQADLDRAVAQAREPLLEPLDGASRWAQLAALGQMADDAMDFWMAVKLLDMAKASGQAPAPEVQRALTTLMPVVQPWVARYKAAPDDHVTELALEYAAHRREWWWLPVLKAAYCRLACQVDPEPDTPN